MSKKNNELNEFCDYLRANGHEDDALEIIFTLYEYLKYEKEVCKTGDKYYNSLVLLFAYLNQSEMGYAFTKEEQIEFLYDNFDNLINNREIETLEDKERWLYDVSSYNPMYSLGEENDSYLYYEPDFGEIITESISDLLTTLFENNLESSYDEIQLYIVGKS